MDDQVDSMKVNKKVCVLGVCESMYTRMVVKYLVDAKVSFDLILVKPKVSGPNLPSFIKKCNLLINLLYSGNFIALSKLDYYPYLLILRMLRYKRFNNFNDLMKPFLSVDLKKYVKCTVPDVNHVSLYGVLQEENYDIGLFAGVGIVHYRIIEAFTGFCLNAHPAPLPDCRGGGAIQFTLYKDLQPAASVHYATKEIDAGGILLISEIQVLPNDTLNSLADRVTIHAAEKLVEVAIMILSGRNMKELPNVGKLNYWKDCNRRIQKIADLKLTELRKKSDQNLRRWPN